MTRARNHFCEDFSRRDIGRIDTAKIPLLCSLCRRSTIGFSNSTPMVLNRYPSCHVSEKIRFKICLVSQISHLADSDVANKTLTFKKIENKN